MSLAAATQHLGEAGMTPIIFGVLAVCALLYRVYLRLLPQPIPGIPYDKKTVSNLLGEYPEMLREVAVTREIQNWLIKKVNKLQVPLCQVFVRPFSTPWVLLADSVEARNLLTRKPEFDRSNFDRVALTHLDGFHSRHVMGDEWKRTRGWLFDLLSPKFVNNIFSPAIYENVFQLLDYWKIKARLASDRPFDATLDLDHVALDAILALLFDQRYRHAALGPELKAVTKMKPSDIGVGSHGEALFPIATFNPFVDAMYVTVEAIKTVTTALYPRFTKYWVTYAPHFAKAKAVRKRVIREQTLAARSRLANGEKARTAIEFMLQREKKAADKAGVKPDYENQTLMDEVGGQFFAGFHTSSTSLSWIFHHLTRAQDVQIKLRRIVQEAFPIAYAERRSPTHAELSTTKIPYLEAVLDEVMRMHATLLSRIALRDTTVFGHRIPKGTTVFMLCNGPGFFAPALDAAADLRAKSKADGGESDYGWQETNNMADFDPERWLKPKDGQAEITDEMEHNANAAPGFAFGLGLRGCWGRKLAYVEMRLLLVMLILHFDFLPVGPDLEEPKKTLSVIHRADECFVRLRIREDAPVDD